MKKNVLITLVLAVLIVISVVQAIQLNGLRAKISEVETLSISTQKVPTASAGQGASGASLPSNIQNLPQMVGGC